MTSGSTLPCCRRTWASRRRPPTSPIGAGTRRPISRTVSSSSSSTGPATRLTATAAAVERVRQVPAALAAGRENLDPALVDAELVRQWALPNTAAQAAFMREGLDAFVEEPAHREALRQAGVEAAEAYEEFAVYLADLATKATGSFVYGGDNYDAVLRVGEGFGFDVHTLREMGREQVASLDAQMGLLAEKIGGTSDWRAVVSGLRDDHPASMDDLLRCYREETARARAFVRESGLVTIPEGEECAVEPAPLFLRAAAPVASYFPPPSFGPHVARDLQRPLHPRRRHTGGAGGPPALQLVLRDPRRHGARGLPGPPPPLRRGPGRLCPAPGPPEHVHGRGLGPLRREHGGGARLLPDTRGEAGAS